MPLVLYGQSLGANVAVEVARRSAPAGLVLEAPFPSLRYLAKLHYPFLPIWPFLGGKYDAEAKVRAVTVPVLVVQGGRDSIVPPEAGRAVFAAAPEGRKEFHLVEEAGHNDVFIVGGERYFGVLKAFLDRVLGHP
jgi:hypothetical protein